MTVIETKLQRLVNTYDGVIKGIEYVAVSNRDRAYGGVVRAGKGRLVEVIAAELVQIAWQEMLHQDPARMVIDKRKMPIGIQEPYIDRIADSAVREYIAQSKKHPPFHCDMLSLWFLFSIHYLKLL